MNTSGKVAVWLVVIAAAASTVLTAKLVQVRNSWTKKAVAFQKEYQASQARVADLTEQLRTVEADKFRAKELWGDYWKEIVTAVQPGGNGVVVANIGVNDFVREKQVLYGFEMQPDGSSVYRGDFTVVTARDVQSQLQPNWKVRVEDVEKWQPQAKWRWRNLLPSAYQKNFDDQIQAIATADDVVADRKKILKEQTEAEVRAKEQLERREAELVGGEQLSKDPLAAVEFREGLVAAVEQTEEMRNQVLRKVDDLRRRLRAVQHGVDRLKQENVELTDKLPQAEPPTVTRND